MNNLITCVANHHQRPSSGRRYGKRTGKQDRQINKLFISLTIGICLPLSSIAGNRPVSKPPTSRNLIQVFRDYKIFPVKEAELMPPASNRNSRHWEIRGQEHLRAVRRKSLRQKQNYFIVVRTEYEKAGGRVSNSVLGALILGVGKGGLKHPPRRRTIYKLNRSGGGGIIEFLPLSLPLLFVSW